MVNINTNLPSLIVLNNLNKATNALNDAIERMTTGYKLNHASDNSANYSIARDMESKLSSYDIAADNTAMGTDLASTATDTLDLVSGHLQRIRDLLEQAANGTYGDDSRKALQSEIDARLAEINRIVDTTEFNGIRLFNVGILPTALNTTMDYFDIKSGDIQIEQNGEVQTVNISKLHYLIITIQLISVIK